MSLKDDVEKLKKDVVFSKDDVVKPKKAFKLPFKFRSKRKYKQGKVLVVWFGSNHHMDFKWGEVNGGLVKVDDEIYKAYERGAVYFHKKFPVIACFEWRLTPLGGSSEDVYRKDLFRSEAVGGDFDKKVAEELGLSAHAQQTIIRSIIQAELDKDDVKKKPKKAVILFIIGGIVLVYLIAKGMGYA